MANSGVFRLTVDWPDTPKRPERPELEAWEPRLETELRLRGNFTISRGLFLFAINELAMENGDSPVGSSQSRADSR